ncbi:MAG: hypothetical protein WBF90_00750 [Rivularia sp. (in: cyanobacteria)]
MNRKTLVNSVALGLTLSSSFFSFLGSETLAAQTTNNRQLLNSQSKVISDVLLDKGLIAQGHPMEIALRVFNSPQAKQLIVQQANQNIGGKVRVDNVEFHNDNGLLRMTLIGKIKIPILRDKTFFLSSWYSVTNNGRIALQYFWKNQPHLHVRRCRRPCRKRRNNMYIKSILPMYNANRGFEGNLNRLLEYGSRLLGYS